MKTIFSHTYAISKSGVIALVDFGERLKELRKRSSLSQEQLAQRLGVTKGMVSSYETSMRMPSYAVLLKIARLFHVTTDYLLGMTESDSMDLSGLTEKQKSIISDLISEFKSGCP